MQPWLRRSGTFFGQTLRRYQARDLLLVETRYGPGFGSPLHSHERALCLLVVQGCCTQTCGNRKRRSNPSQLNFHPAGHAHSYRWQNAGGRCLQLEFDARWLDRVPDHSPVLARPAEFTGGMPVWLAMRLYRELRASDQLSPLAIEGLALELVAQAGRDLAVLPGVRPPAWLERVKEFITVHFREQVTLAEMAREAGVHPVHLVTVFRRHMRCTPFDFLRRLRVDFAAGQLVHSETPLVEIALTAGFADQSHFCRLFKIMTGMTPTAYRELLTRGS